MPISSIYMKVLHTNIAVRRVDVVGNGQLKRGASMGLAVGRELNLNQGRPIDGGILNRHMWKCLADKMGLELTKKTAGENKMVSYTETAIKTMRAAEGSRPEAPLSSIIEDAGVSGEEKQLELLNKLPLKDIVDMFSDKEIRSLIRTLSHKERNELAEINYSMMHLKLNKALINEPDLLNDYYSRLSRNGRYNMFWAAEFTGIGADKALEYTCELVMALNGNMLNLLYGTFRNNEPDREFLMIMHAAECFDKLFLAMNDREREDLLRHVSGHVRSGLKKLAAAAGEK